MEKSYLSGVYFKEMIELSSAPMEKHANEFKNYLYEGEVSIE